MVGGGGVGGGGGRGEWRCWWWWWWWRRGVDSEFKIKIIQSVIDCLTPSACQSLTCVTSEANKQSKKTEKMR